MNIENLEQAMKFLKDEYGYTFEKVSDHTYNQFLKGDDSPDLMTTGEIVSLAKKCKGKRYSKIVKWDNNKRNRSAEKQCIYHKKFDKLHSKKQANPSNIWHWD